MENHLKRPNKGSCTADLEIGKKKIKNADREKRWRNRKKENLVQKAQQLENGSAPWVGRLCAVRVYLFMRRQRAHARVRFRADMPTVDGPTLIKEMSGLINQHAAPSHVAAGSVNCPPNAALGSYAGPQ